MFANHDDPLLSPSPLLGVLAGHTCKEDMLFKDNVLQVHVVL